MDRYVEKHPKDGRNIVPLRNGRFEVVMTAPGEMFIQGPAVEALARYESFPRIGETGCIIDPDSESIVNVTLLELRFAGRGDTMRVQEMYYGEQKWNLPFIPGKTWFKDYQTAVKYKKAAAEA